jgi:hypothetical protein
VDFGKVMMIRVEYGQGTRVSARSSNSFEPAYQVLLVPAANVSGLLLGNLVIPWRRPSCLQVKRALFTDRARQRKS